MNIAKTLAEVGEGVLAYTQLPGSWGWSNAGLELTRFGGHFTLWVGGVHDGKNESAVSAGVSPADGRAGSSWCRVDPGRPAFLWDTDVSGFGCKATPAGRKVFIFQYRRRGQGPKTAPKRITLGKYGELTPDRARALAANLRLEVRAGGDPAAAWRPGESPTMSDLAERFLQEHLPTKKRPPRDSTIRYYDTLFRCHVLPELGDLPVGFVTPTDVERLHAGMRAKPYVANRTLSLLQQAFDQAERWGWRPQHTNPAVHIDRYPEERRGAKKEVMLTAEQMARLLDAIEAVSGRVHSASSFFRVRSRGSTFMSFRPMARQYWLEPEIELAKNYGFADSDLRRIEKLIDEHEQEIRDAWKRHFGS